MLGLLPGFLEGPVKSAFEKCSNKVSEVFNEINKLFNDLYVHLSAVDAAQKSKSAPPPAGGVERIKAAAGQLPEPARSMLEKLSGAAAFRATHQEPPPSVRRGVSERPEERRTVSCMMRAGAKG